MTSGTAAGRARANAAVLAPSPVDGDIRPPVIVAGAAVAGCAVTLAVTLMSEAGLILVLTRSPVMTQAYQIRRPW